MKLRNKTVVITGGTKGLGMALAVSFLKEKANVAVCSRNQDKLKIYQREFWELKRTLGKKEI